MNSIPADILIQVFRYYLGEQSVMPTTLTKVCRNWYNLVIETPLLSFRVVVDIKNKDIIPSLIYHSSPLSAGFKSYLARTDEREGYNSIQLEIEIRSRSPVMDEHDSICQGSLYGSCRFSQCKYAMERRDQMDDLLAFLLGQPLSHLSGVHHENTAGDQKGNHGKNRIGRCRSLIIEWDEHLQNRTSTWSEPRTDVMSHSWITAPHLVHLSLDGVTPWYMPHENFAPNLTSLSMKNTQDYATMNVPRLKSLTIGGNHCVWAYQGTTATFTTVVELCIECTQWSYQVSRPRLPNLQRMKIYQRCPSVLWEASYWLPDFEITDDNGHYRQLEEVYLIDVLPPALITFKGVYTIVNARKILFQNTPKLENEYSTPSVIESQERAKASRPPKFLRRLFRILQKPGRSNRLGRYYLAKQAKKCKTPPLPPPPPGSPHSIPSPTTSSSSVSSMTRYTTFEANSPSSLLRAFLRTCNPAAQFEAVDERSSGMLEAALKRIEEAPGPNLRRWYRREK